MRKLKAREAKEVVKLTNMSDTAALLGQAFG